MTIILHITPADRWQQAQLTGIYSSDTLASEGFIHCSMPSQVVDTAHRFYRGQPSLVLLCIDANQVEAAIKVEAAESGELFPHIYGALNLTAVVDVLPFPPQTDGTFALPAAIAKQSQSG
jgi:uncharacterized protein (DUF952 family)